MKKFICVLSIFIIMSFSAYYYLPSYLSTTSNIEDIKITVPSGASLNYVAELLYQEGIIKSKLWFKYRSQQEGIDRNIKPGSYTLPPNIKFEEIFSLLQRGTLEKPIIVTIPEGFTLYQIATRIEGAGLGTAEEFVEATKQYFKTKEHTFDTTEVFFEMEGYLYPDTYYFSEKQTVLEIVSILAKTMEGVFTKEYRQRTEEMGLSLHEVLTIASLIEREASHDGERAAISGVIYNRLKKNMLLQIDATVIYGIGKGKEHINRVLFAHLEDASPFNTYKAQGLPPGPIAAPSKASIHAALYPEDHDYLYYVLGEGGHVFSKTYREHEINVANYRKMVNQN
ncbi:endolytic transglycosylase MltG [Clostridium formicaceticum]|uniref:Endolytic murein transglycosylase n=1 Tax=Clostridium formicaceticum TaxID=1497 RepID=A0AAC9RH87_9CLOT|nr:endolytic transglycosylase MltG [Clostridium formicaceticum]AOY75447.1 aminodeoxychorismate lyase [Clostridium formicaceticum]ARE85732.1 putative aminodeoxychorismate lyase [Clostridium formicaceticum]